MSERTCLSSRPSFFALFLSLFLSLILLSGCGGGSAETPPATTPGTGTDKPAATPLSVLGPATGNVGQTLTYLVTGGKPPYNVFSSASGVANVTPVTQLGAYIFSAKLQKPGAAILILTDSSNGTTSQIVTVSTAPLKTTAGANISLAIEEQGKYAISGGTGSGYTATTSNASVASASIAGGIPGLFASSLVIKGLKLGTATITLCDIDCTNNIAINVTITSKSPGQSLFTTAPDNITMLTSATASFDISGGTAPYTASSSNDAMATATVNGTRLQITSKTQAGTADILVKDSTGTSVKISTTISSGGVPFSTTAPLAITLGIGSANAQTYTNTGGTTPYTCTSSNAMVATVSCPGNGSIMTITGVRDGLADILVQDATGTNSQKIAVNIATGTGLTVIGSSKWNIPTAHCTTTPYTPYSNPPVYTIYFINGGKPPYTVSSTTPLAGSIIAVGTTSTPAVIPPTAILNADSWTVSSSGGYFVVGWPDAPNSDGLPANHCAVGTATFKVIDADGNLPASSPSFDVTSQ